MRASLEHFAAATRERLRPFIDTEINPGAHDRDASGSVISRALMRRSAEVGLFGSPLPKAIGGQGLDLLHWGLVLEQVGYLSDDYSFPTLLGLRTAIAGAIYDSQRADLIERYAAPMARGDLAGALAYSDGHDPFSFRTQIKKKGSAFVLDGEKILVTGGSDADVFMTYAQEESGDLVVALIERSDPGVTTEVVPVVGLRALGLSSLKFVDTPIPPERIMVARDGLSHSQIFLNARRALLCCAPLGGMTAIFEYCIHALGETVRYGQTLLEMQNVQAQLGRMYIDIEASRALLYSSLERATLREAGYEALFDPVVSAAKHFAASRAADLTATAFRLLGGKGYTRASKVERFLRDTYGLMAGGGAQDIIEIELGIAAAKEAQDRLRRGKK
jgi:acyl-CoA dehydrogenase